MKPNANAVHADVDGVTGNGLTLAEQKEYLTYAAKAMGFDVDCYVSDSNLCYAIRADNDDLWFPLTWNEAAFSIMTYLCLSPKLCAEQETTTIDVPDTDGTVSITVNWDGDRDEATRIALLAAAAEIGKRKGCE